MSAEPIRVFLYVQNLLGIGHLHRAAGIASALSSEGMEVWFVSGGFPVGDLPLGKARFVQLEPVRAADETFKILVDSNDKVIDDAFKERRKTALLELFDQVRPDLLITELFPFGRRQMRFELIPLLERASCAEWQPIKLSAMRDILVTKARVDRNLEIVDTLNQFYDAVLIHGDETFIALDQTFSYTDRISIPIRYTGYIVNDLNFSEEKGSLTKDNDTILVSVGGGAVGAPLLNAIADYIEPLSAPGKAAHGKKWHILLGHHASEASISRLMALRSETVTVEISRPNLPELMSRAALSISQGGYNTVMEILATGVPSIVVPFEEGVETEQRLRADLLEAAGRLSVISADKLGLEAFETAIRKELARPDIAENQIDIEGGQGTARIVRDLLEARDRT